MLRTRQPYGLSRLVGLLVILLTLLFLSLATGASVASAQGTTAGEKPKYGGIVRMAEREPPNLDPHLSISFLTHNAASLIYNGLVRLTYTNEQKNPDDLTILPDLAERWEYVDPQTLVFYLRRGVKFHENAAVNGRKMKAPDVDYFLDRFECKFGFG